MSDLQLANIGAITGHTDKTGLGEAEKAALAAGGGRVVLYHLSGPFSFGAAKGMARRLAASDDDDALVLDMAEVSFLDSSASLALEDAIKQAQGHDKQVFLVGVRPDVAPGRGQGPETPRRARAPARCHHHVSRLDALEQAAAMVRP